MKIKISTTNGFVHDKTSIRALYCQFFNTIFIGLHLNCPMIYLFTTCKVIGIDLSILIYLPEPHILTIGNENDVEDIYKNERLFIPCTDRRPL